MKKLNLTNIIEGVRKLGAVKAFFAHIEEAYIESLERLTKGLVAESGSYIVLFGCENSGAGLDYDISAGAILKDGEIYLVPAIVETAGAGEVPVLSLNTVNTTLKYTDASDQTTLVTRTLTWSMAASGSGLVDFSALVSLKTAMRAMLDLSKEVDIRIKVANHILDADDAGANVVMNLAGANTVTVPPNSDVAFPIGTEILITQEGAGKTTLVQGAGVTINSEDSLKSIGARYTAAALVKKDTNVWYLFGNLTT